MVLIMKIKFKVPFAEGLHARPAAELVKVCQKASSEIIMSKGDTEVNPKSILGIISLGAANGEEVAFDVQGEDEQEIADKLTAFFAG